MVFVFFKTYVHAVSCAMKFDDYLCNKVINKLGMRYIYKTDGEKSDLS